MAAWTDISPILLRNGVTSASFESLTPYERGWASSANITLYLNNWGNTDNTLLVDVYWGTATKGLVAVNSNINWSKDAALSVTFSGTLGTTTIVPGIIEIPKVRARYMKLVFTLAGTTKTVDVAAYFYGKSGGSGNLVQDQAAEASLATIATNQTSGSQQVQGNIASGATDSGNPQKVGGVNRTTQPTLTDGQRGDLQLDTRANLKATIYAANGANPFAALADNTDAVAVSATVNKLGVMARNNVFNGTTWDRQYGDVTAGAWVNVKGGMAPSGSALNTYSVHVTTNTTNTPTASTAYVSSIAISAEVAGTTSTLTIQDKQGTPLKLVNGFSTTVLTTTPTVVNFQTPVKMVSGIDVITSGAVAATIDVWVNYYQ